MADQFLSQDEVDALLEGKIDAFFRRVTNGN